MTLFSSFKKCLQDYFWLYFFLLVDLRELWLNNTGSHKQLPQEPVFKTRRREWLSSYDVLPFTIKPRPQIHPPSTGTVRPHTTPSKGRRMKWVRLPQLSQTLGVNDIITALWKHKPAYTFLLLLLLSPCRAPAPPSTPRNSGRPHFQLSKQQCCPLPESSTVTEGFHYLSLSHTHTHIKAKTTVC